MQREQGIGGLFGGVGGNAVEALLLLAKSLGILDQFQNQDLLLGIVRAEPGQMAGDSICWAGGKELLIDGGFAGQRRNAVGANRLLQEVAAVGADDAVVAITPGIVDDGYVSVHDASRADEVAG